MKTIIVLATLVFGGLSAGSLMAQSAAPGVQHSRTYATYGGTLTKGFDTPWSLSPSALGGYSRAFTFLDATSSLGGWYYGIGASISGSGGNVSMADTWLATVGWMGNPLALLGNPAMDFDLNLAASPTWGTRIKDKVVQGGGYLGVGFSLGLSLPLPVTIPFVGDGSIGVAWDPVVPVAMVFDSHDVENRGYMNFALTWTMKWNLETKTLPWKP